MMNTSQVRESTELAAHLNALLETPNQGSILKFLLDYLLNSLPVNIFLVNAKGRIVWCNTRLLSVFKLKSLKEFVGTHVNQWEGDLWNNYQDNLVLGIETTFEEKTQYGWYLTTRKPMIENGKVVGILGVSMDITEKKNAEIAKNEFLRSMRHDVRTPVSGMVSVAHVLKEAIEDQELKGFSDSLVEASTALLNLLDQAFDSVKFATGELLSSKQGFSLEKSLRTVFELHQAKACMKSLVLVWDYDPQIPSLLIGDALCIQRLVWELLTNSIKYTETGRILLSTHLTKQDKAQVWVEISVQDTGIGIPADKHEAIFQRFTRLTPASSEKPQGEGMGLFNVKQLISDLGAQLKLTSSTGQGSTFACLIPLKLPNLP